MDTPPEIVPHDSAASFIPDLETCRARWNAMLQALGSNRSDVEQAYIELFRDAVELYQDFTEIVEHGEELREVVAQVRDLVSSIEDTLGARSGWSESNGRLLQIFRELTVVKNLDAYIRSQPFRIVSGMEAMIDLLSTPAQQQATGSGVAESPADRAKRRQAVVYPILAAKNRKRGVLATESGVGKATVYGYLDGSRKTISRDNRQALADTLGIPLDKLPQ